MFKKIFLILLITFPQMLLAQQYVSDANPIWHFQNGLDLLDKKKYSAARESFENYLRQEEQGEMSVDAQYYIAYAALRLYHNDGEARLAEFVEQHNTHPKAIRANYELGDFYFKDNNFKKAVSFLEKTDAYSLTPTEQTERNFKLAYAYFSQQQFDKAKPYFDQVKNTQGSYSPAASYYAGYIAFENGNYSEALTDLRRAGQEKSYAQAVPYLIANIYYKQKKYDELITYGEQILQGASGGSQDDIKNASEINLLLGEAFFARQDYAKASPYFEAYAAGSRAEPGVLYRMGYAQYKSGRNEEAINNFKQIAAQDDPIGQYASYYLGLLYVQQKNMPFAASALERAASLSYSEEIQEQASFNGGKVYFSTEEFSRAIDALTTFKKEFPNSRYTVEVNDLLSEAYLNTQNYPQAMAFIESLPNKTAQVRKAYQKVSFYAGTQMFNDSKFYESVQLFEKSLESPMDEDLVVAANFWRGEAYSTGKKYEEAIKAYENVFRQLIRRRAEGQNAMYLLKSHYGVAYAYYNTQAYKQALEHFNTYVKQINEQPRGSKERFFYEDALVRQADCYYVTKAYGKAIDTYQQAIQQNNPDISYAYYQIGIIQGIQGKTREAKNSLERVISQYPDSRYHDDAVFQKAQVSIQEGSYQEAITGFTQLIRNSPKSSNLLPYALLRRALAYTNRQQYAQASEDYKKILDEHIDHATANSALLGLQEVLSKSGSDGSDLEPYLARYRKANPNNKSLANIDFESAKNLYFAQKYDQAVEKLSDFVKNNPNNANVDEARFYIGESYYRVNQIDRALEVYYEMALKGTSARLSRAIQRIAELEQARGNYDQAITYFKKLETLARNKREQFEAWSGLMTSYFEQDQRNKANLDSVERYAGLILQKGNVSARAENMGLLYQGKVSFARGNYDQAISNFRKALNTAKDIYGAEAQYLMALAQYEQKKYNESIETLYDLNKNFSIYEYWLGQSFLLIADNYVALDEDFQAKATLESLIKNSPVREIVQTAQNKLKTLSTAEAEEARKARQADSLKTARENQVTIDKKKPARTSPADTLAPDSLAKPRR